MKKQANRRAFFVCGAIFLLYASVVGRLPERLSIVRVADGPSNATAAASMAVTGATQETTSIPEPISAAPVQPLGQPPVAQPAESLPEHAAQRTPVSVPQSKSEPPKVVETGGAPEPAIFISVPIVVHAIKTRLIDKDGLIFTKKEGYNIPSWKKPLEILRDKDEEGLKYISRNIGKRAILDFLKKEGITIKDGLTVEEIILGRGYTLEKTKLTSLFDSQVTEEYAGLFPYTFHGVGMFKGRDGFELKKARDETLAHHDKEEQEWLMPNLVDLPVKVALDKLVGRTAKVRIYGSGTVTEQVPKAFERLRGEQECVIYGRSYRP